MTKICPYCLEAIQQLAVKCRHCGEFVDGQAARRVTAVMEDPPEEVLFDELHPVWKVQWPKLLLGVLLIPFLVGIFYIAWICLERASIKYRITTKRLTAQSGVFHRNVKEVLLNDIASIHIRRGFWGLVFGYGTIMIGTSGTGEIDITIKSIARPQEIKELLQKYNRI
ncbi:PH domain-containing protein [Omnitrophica bacterium]|nr:PH domain-containing protein [Candidatus Omnitrophota bacterium]